MKSLEELKALRDKMQHQVGMRREENDNIRVVVGMATCGIAAGARPVMTELTKLVSDKGVTNVTIAQTGCIGVCQYEPIVEVCVPGEEKITYVRMTPERAREVFEKHVLGGKPINEFTIGYAARQSDANK